MNMRLGIYVFFLGALTIVACKKNKEPLKPTNGIYRGVFNRIIDDDTTATGLVFLALNDFDSSFTMQGDTNSFAPTSCSGKFSLIGNDKISFTNTAPIGGEVEDSLFILDTIYQYEFLDTHFYLKFYYSEPTLFGGEDNRLYDYNLSRF